MRSSTPRVFIGATTFVVKGMGCERCRRAVTEQISAIDGVAKVLVDATSGTVTVIATRPVDRADIAAAVERNGCTVVA